jgi:hypothetical protein
MRGRISREPAPAAWSAAASATQESPISACARAERVTQRPCSPIDPKDRQAECHRGRRDAGLIPPEVRHRERIGPHGLRGDPQQRQNILGRHASTAANTSHDHGFIARY